MKWCSFFPSNRNFGGFLASNGFRLSARNGKRKCGLSERRLQSIIDFLPPTQNEFQRTILNAPDRPVNHHRIQFASKRRRSPSQEISAFCSRGQLRSSALTHWVRAWPGSRMEMLCPGNLNQKKQSTWALLVPCAAIALLACFQTMSCCDASAIDEFICALVFLNKEMRQLTTSLSSRLDAISLMCNGRFALTSN